MAVIARLLAQDLKLIRSKQRPFRRFVERLALRCMDHPSLRRLLAAKIRRIDDLDSLGEALGRPRTILCLGNGPSSRSEEHTSELQSLMRISYAVFCLKNKNKIHRLKTLNYSHTTKTNLQYDTSK